jgi:HPt (histidine-containing phosphotransfer) domain-containing protein
MTDSIRATLPIDFAVLRLQTGGDRRLEREVLALFVAKSMNDAGRIAQATSQRMRRDLAHSLVGSARAVGAAEVARLAEAVEQAPGFDAATHRALTEAILAAQTFISERLST